ncbi:hypothetical protein [Pseudonocardia abyssalis]|uniref:Roadblock/LAMTOR2 domain-containing protein n=1 Tax=Pseudonocardia abyssalis TaxID=2792008 RepID=A0ABS6UT78_9PSEU|nr:hypothetical protein [Pseudonocardia abyssalis]MBW0114376.1 hypothetical protein [Pseudonocardia abyssalis]MBW0135460.1 hypothetical protein [Pseudonocardia abyssalis]
MARRVGRWSPASSPRPSGEFAAAGREFAVAVRLRCRAAGPSWSRPLRVRTPAGRAQHQHLADALDTVAAATSTAPESDLISLLTLCEGVTRRFEAISTAAVAVVDNQGTFLTRGYPSTAAALSDLLSWEHRDARRFVAAATDVHARTTLSGAQGCDTSKSSTAS